jgi:2,4-dienoyl-CoA reductase-like NADH-dependent reductase (Old Yellow Enzyme family)
MWQPPERIKHAPPVARWPSETEAAASRWFSAIDVGPVRLEQRTWVPAMVPWRATDEGYVTEALLDWYARFARGRPGAIVVEATGVRDVPSGPLLRIGHDRFVPGLAKLVETVRAASEGYTRVFIQLIDFLPIRRRPERDKFLGRFLRITQGHRDRLNLTGASDEDVRAALLAAADDTLERTLSSRELEALRFGHRERVTDMELEHIRELPRVLPEIFAAAAARAQRAGFDGVELHYAHAYTMASFLSARNDRDDGYGRTREGRLRLPLEVYHTVRERVGRGFVVGTRFLSDEIIEGGSRVEDAEYYGAELARAGLDFLSLSRGGKFEDAQQPAVGWSAYPYTGPSGYECIPTIFSDARGPFGRNVDPCARVRSAVRAAGEATPIVLIGGISTFEQAEAALERGVADIVGSARQTLADPDWFRKVRLGRGAEVRRCAFTNYCEGLDQKHKQVTCKLWDRVDLDAADAHLDAEKKKRLVAPPWKA